MLFCLFRAVGLGSKSTRDLTGGRNLTPIISNPFFLWEKVGLGIGITGNRAVVSIRKKERRDFEYKLGAAGKKISS